MQLTGSWVDYVIVFWAGVLVSFSPCIYPLIPITASFIGGVNPRQSKFFGFFVSVIYVFGLAVSYSALAVVAALTGRFFGDIQNHPVVYFIISGFLFFFGLTMLHVIPLGMIGLDFKKKIKIQNTWSVLVFGMAAGLIVSPCTAPILGTILLYISSKQNIIHAVSLMFVFSYGVGFLLIIVGTFSGLLSGLPKSGAWMNFVRYLCATVLFLAASYFLIKGIRLMI